VILSDLSLAQLRQRCLDPERVGVALRARLAADPRAGARALGERMASRRRSVALELRRLRELYALERALRAAGATGAGYPNVAGVDEVGMGPLAGPVVAAAVVLDGRARLYGLRDSKQLSAAQREGLAGQIRERATALALGSASSAEIDRINIFQAGLLAMRRAVEALSPLADFVVVDARTIPEIRVPQRALVRADSRVACVAAASIVAKVERDRIMHELDQKYPGYGFARHSGYPTQDHLAALRKLGPTPVHRQSFRPVRLVSEALDSAP